MLQLYLVVLIFSSAVVHCAQVADSANFVFGDCSARKNSCSECYQTLVKSLLGSDENVVNLSRAFYPPETNPAEFIAVTYQYEIENETTGEVNGTETWFWAASGAYFLHPLHVFTYISLLFDKPEPYFAQTAHVTLRSSCKGAQREHMILLTHRLKTFIKQLSADGDIDDNYNAMVADREEVSKKIRAENNRLTNIIITLQVALVIFVVALIAIILLLRRYTNFVQRRLNGFKKKLDSSEIIQQQSTVISLSIISFHLLIYIVALDGVALCNRENPPDQEISVIYRNDEPGDPFSIFYNLPLIIMTFDIIVAIFSFAMLVAALLHCSIRFFKPEMKKLSKRWVLYLYLTSVGPVLALLMHAPFITNAYLNDAFHASSIFLYYAASIFIGFLLLKKVAIHTCLSSVRQAKHAKWEKPLNNTKVTVSQGTLTFKKSGSGTLQTVHIARGYLTLDCHEANLVRKKLIVFKDNHIEVKGGQLTLHDNNKSNGNVESTDSYEELHIEEGSLQLQQGDLHYSGDEVDAVAIDIEYGTKLKLAKGGTLKVSYNESNGECYLDIQEGKLVGKELRCMCFTKCINTVPGAATCFISTTIAMALFFLSMLSLLACYFVLIPINMSISNAGDRLVGIYQSLFVIVGAIFAYKALFKPEHSGIQEAVKARKEPLTGGTQNAKWRSLSDKEKLDEFYGIVVNIVTQHYTENCNN